MTDPSLLLMSLTLAEDRIAQLENGLQQLRSQLLDTHEEDSVIIMTINNILKDENSRH